MIMRVCCRYDNLTECLLCLHIHKSGKFERFGSGGFGTTWSPVCLMNLNNVNEKVFLILWVLLCLLIVTSGQISFHILMNGPDICRVTT